MEDALVARMAERPRHISNDSGSAARWHWLSRLSLPLEQRCQCVSRHAFGELYRLAILEIFGGKSHHDPRMLQFSRQTRRLAEGLSIR